eukprot:SAG11_NODE_12883_length_681_cov_0.965636_2_plen_69_part_01
MVRMHESERLVDFLKGADIKTAVEEDGHAAGQPRSNRLAAIVTGRVACDMIKYGFPCATMCQYYLPHKK